MANEEDYNSLVKLLGRYVSTLGPCPLTLAGLQRLQKIDEHEYAIVAGSFGLPLQPHTQAGPSGR